MAVAGIVFPTIVTFGLYPMVVNAVHARKRTAHPERIPIATKIRGANDQRVQSERRRSRVRRTWGGR